jgi:hypothetical protein
MRASDSPAYRAAQRAATSEWGISSRSASSIRPRRSTSGRPRTASTKRSTSSAPPRRSSRTRGPATVAVGAPGGGRPSEVGHAPSRRALAGKWSGTRQDCATRLTRRQPVPGATARVPVRRADAGGRSTR